MDKRQLLRYAYENTEFYKKKYESIDLKSEWDTIPITSKCEVAHAGLSIVSSKYFSQLNSSNIVTDYTSGSTGECLEIYTTRAEQTKSLLSLWLYRKKYYGIDTNSKFCYFYSFRHCNGDAAFEYRKNALGFSKGILLEKNLEAIYKSMYDFEPEWLLLQPSVAIILSRYIFETGLPPIPTVHYIELSGEMFTKQQKNFIANAFDASVASQYGCNELGTIAYQCPFGNLHIMDHNVYVNIVNNEVLNKNMEYGNIIVTARNNLVMPLIKYDTGDIGKIKKVKCKCHNSSAVIELLGARKNDLVVLNDTETISADIFKRVFQGIEWNIDGRIFQYRVEQEAVNLFTISIATDDNAERVEKLFYHFIADTRLVHSEFNFRYYKFMLPDKETGKFKFFICNC